MCNILYPIPENKTKERGKKIILVTKGEKITLDQDSSEIIAKWGKKEEEKLPCLR